jgi:hypothetical protein
VATVWIAEFNSQQEWVFSLHHHIQISYLIFLFDEYYELVHRGKVARA